MRGADQPPRRQGQQMGDADHDFGGGYHQQGGQMPRHGATDVMTSAKVQRSVNLAGAVTSLALVIGLGFWGYQLAVRDVNGVPVIQAMDGPMRISPDDPGGEIADNQGLAVNTVVACPAEVMTETGSSVPSVAVKLTGRLLITGLPPSARRSCGA